VRGRRTWGSTLVCASTPLKTAASMSMASVSLRPPRLACMEEHFGSGADSAPAWRLCPSLQPTALPLRLTFVRGVLREATMTTSLSAVLRRS
jgi:hypothetical protein